MYPARLRPCLTFCCLVLLVASQAAAAKTICVNPAGSNGCFAKIQAAVNAAAANDVINVARGKY